MPKLLNKAGFLALLPDARRWAVTGGDIALYTERSAYIVRDAVLAEVHPDLHMAARHSLAWAVTYGHGAVRPAEVLQCQVEAYHTNWVVNTPPLPLRGIRRVENLQLTTVGNIRLYGRRYFMAARVPGKDGQLVSVKPFVSVVDTGWIDVSFAWLEERCPGWYDRYATAATLDCDGATRAQHVLSVTPDTSLCPSVLPALDLTTAGLSV